MPKPKRKTRRQEAIDRLTRYGAREVTHPDAGIDTVVSLLAERDHLRRLVDQLNNPDDAMREVFAADLRRHGYTVTAPVPQVGCNDRHGAGCECWKRDANLEAKGGRG